MNLYDKRVLNEAFKPIAEKCFDRKPDHKTPPTTPNNMLNAKATMITSLIFGGMWAMNFPLYRNEAFFSGTPNLLNVALFACVLSNFSRHMSQAYRFGQVAKQNWAILDQPPPKKVKSRSTAWSIMPAPSIG